MGLPPRAQGAAGKRKRSNCDQDDEEDVKPIINLDSDDDSDASDSDDSDSDEDAQDGEGTGVIEHHEDSEDLPKCVAYDKDFAQVGHDLIGIPAKALQILRESGCDNKRVQGCQGNADELAKLPQAKREKVALLGNTGAGKSSLLNSLLGLPGMAKAMAGGQSCTYVGTEYEQPFPGQAKKLAARVEYFDIDAIRELLSRLLQDYNTWNFEQEDDWDDEEKQELNRKSKTAFSTFRSLFCDKTEFESPRAATEFLEQAFKNSEETDALSVLGVWCEDLLEEKEADEEDHTEYLDAHSQEELLEQLDPLVSANPRYTEPTLWPLVKKVRIGIEGPRILKYVTLVDLPGLDDTNQVRVNASYDIMRSCDAIWVVAKIDRAITETSVDSLLMRFGKSYKMVMICTGTDDNIDAGLALHLENEGQSVGNHDELLIRERELRKLVKRLPKKMETRQAKLEGRNKTKEKKKKKKKAKPLTDNAKAKLRAQITQFEADLKVAEAALPMTAQERFELLVDARNANTIRRLKEEKSDHLSPGKELDVFCVSNLHYAALKGARVINGPRLSAEMTGVPALRSYVLDCTAPDLLQAMDDYINHKFTIFMKGLAMWAKSYSVEGSEQLLDAIKKPQGEAQNVVDGFVDRLMAGAEELVIKPIEVGQAELVAAAGDIVEKKLRGWYWSTIRAFIRRDGNHRTSVVPQQSWNEQFLEAANKLTRESWENFAEREKELAKELKEGLLMLVRKVSTTINNHPASMVLPMDRIKEIFEAQVEGIEQACREHQHELKKELRNIKLDFTQDRHSGYFSQAMDEAYKKCQGDSGTGIKGRSISTFETHLKLEGKRSPFAVMCKKLGQAVSKDAKAKSKILTKKTDDIMSEIYRQFDDMVDEKIDDKAEEELRKDFRVFLEKAEPLFEEIEADLARVKRRYGV